MNGRYAIDFRHRADAVPHILAAVEAAGIALRSIRLIPAAAGGRATLHLQLDAGRDELTILRERLLGLESTIEVIHKAGLEKA